MRLWLLGWEVGWMCQGNWVPSNDDTTQRHQLTPAAGGRSVTLISRSLGDTAFFADELAQLLLPGDVVLLIGDLGAGKTAFTKALARSFAIDEPITSPTFTIMRTYEGTFPNRRQPVTLAHLDAYRLEHADAIEDLGLFELLDRGAVAVIEWGDLVAEAFDTAPLVVRISVSESADFPEPEANGEFTDLAPRYITCSAYPDGPWQDRLLMLETKLQTLSPGDTPPHGCTPAHGGTP
jgi:tRNA threonylcarbamoyladenosine biosynthesis protein TsaE